MSSEDASYVCTLDEKSVKKAKEELNENPKDRLAAVQALREWIEAQPHIRWPATSTHVLLTFLRGAKFSQLRAREMIEGQLCLRTEAAHWYLNLDTMDKGIQKLLDAGFIFKLPGHDNEGRSVTVQRYGMFDPSFKQGYSRHDLMRAALVMGMLTQRGEITQVNGMVYLVDFTGATAKHISNIMTNTDLQNWHKKWRKCSPGRFKKFLVYNAGSFFETLMSVFRPLLSKKFQDRLIVCNTAESLYEHIPKEMLPEEYLPDDYKGPSAGTTQDLIMSFKNEIMDPDVRKEFLWRTGPEFGLDESKRPTTEEVPTQHFRKLNVD